MNRKSGRTWINFRDLRAKLRFEDVLRHYQVEVRRKGDQHLGRCPLPGHTAKRDAFSFSANLDRGIFQCFVCKAKGNLLDFAVLMEEADLENGGDLRKVAVKLRDVLLNEDISSAAEDASQSVPESTKEERINAALDFELKGLDSDHSYLANRGFSRETMSFFGVGYCGRGLLKGRIAIPIHDDVGQLVGYAGRVSDNREIADDNPRYVFPEDRGRNGEILRFDKSLLLYNAHRITSPCDEIIVVESFTAVWWLHQLGFPNVVATMGTSCSDTQIQAILSLVNRHGLVCLLPDGNEPGFRLGKQLMDELCHSVFVRWLALPEDKQPTDLSESDIRTYLIT